MENYILKLNSGTDYKLYKGTTLVSDSDLTTLFGVAGEMYLSFDFNSGTPSSLTTFTITDSSDNAVIMNTDVTVAEGKNYKATWSASATTFDTFEELAGKALDESQLSFLMGKIKDAYDTVEYPISADKRLAEIAWDIIGANEDGIKLVEVKNTTGSNLSIYLGRNASDKQLGVPYRTSAFILLTHRKATTGMAAFTVGIMFRGSDTYKVVDQDGSTNAGAYYRLPVTVYNALTANSMGYALDATQGKILADRIGDLTTLTTTDKTSAVAAINEVNSNLNDVAYVGDVLSTPSSVAYVGTDNIQDGAVTAEKMDLSTIEWAENSAGLTIGKRKDTGDEVVIMKITGQTGNVNEEKLINVSSAIPNISGIVNFWGIINAGNGLYIPLNYANPDGAFFSYIKIVNGVFYISTNTKVSAWANKPFEINIIASVASS